MVKDKVLKILAHEAHVPIDSILMDHTLLVDLKIDGDDAWEVFENCHEQLNLDLQSLQFMDYFSPEHCYKGFLYLFRKLKYKDEHLARKKKQFTVAKLVDACERGSFEKLV